MKRILMISNDHAYTYNFRKEIIRRLIDAGCEIHIIVPYGAKVPMLEAMGCTCHDLPLDKRGVNPFVDLKLIMGYRRLIKSIKPDLVLSYTIKPNLYGGMLCRMMKIPYMANITGLGTAFDKAGLLSRFVVMLYRMAFAKIDCVFFQNEESVRILESKGIGQGVHRLIPGSGVNIDEFKEMTLPVDDTVEFLFVSRVLKEKGIEEYLDAAKEIRALYPNTVFRVLGRCEQDYQSVLDQYSEDGSIIYHGLVDNVKDYYERAHCTIHPSYYNEGMSNVLLESAAMGRVLITTDHSGCRETVDEGYNGFLMKPGDSDDLIRCIIRFLEMTYEDKSAMGHNGRMKMEKDFDRCKVVEAYVEEINRCLGVSL